MPTLPLYILRHEDGLPLDPDGFTLKIPKEHQYMWGHDNDFMLALGIISEEQENYHLKPLQDWINNVSRNCYIVALDHTSEYEGGIKVHLKFLEWGVINKIYKTFGDGPALYTECDGVTVEYGVEEIDAAMGLRTSLKHLIAKEKFKPQPRLETAITEEWCDPHALVSLAANDLLNERKKRLQYIEAENYLDRIGLILNTVLGAIEKKTARRKFESKKEHDLPPAPPETIQAKLAILPLSTEARNKVERDLKKLSSTPEGTAEHAALTDYLNWVAELPWGVVSQKPIELEGFIRSLNQTHYGLEDVKNHLLEHIALERIMGRNSGTIMCLVGGPGTGKTTIAKSIANAANRQLIRIPLGGLYDDAELRGHRRVYVAARPGRIITSLRDCRTSDPVILLDEVDKLARAQKGGDLTSTLLEILDPEQNSGFIDRYLEFGFDLSKAMFICTANDYLAIPPPLLDRVEVIRFREYTEPERLSIIRDYIIPKYTNAYNMSQYRINWDDMVLTALSKQPGIRKAEELVRKILRMAALYLLTNNKEEITITPGFTASLALVRTTQTMGF